MSLSIIVAVDKQNCIGGNNALLWKIPADMKFFKETTTGHTIVMGKKTFLSIGRPLPNRRNVVLSRDTNFSNEGVEVYASIEELLTHISHEEETFVIGGGEIYKQLLPHTNKLYVTEVNHTFNGDTFFPPIDISDWKLINSRTVTKDDTTPYDISFKQYLRITPRL